MTDSPWVSPFADEDIVDDVIVYRAVFPGYVDWQELDSRGYPTMRSSQIFQDMSPDKALERGYPAPAMSVALSHVLEEHGERPSRVLDDFGEDWGVAEFSVGSLRDIVPKLGVCEDRLEVAPWHGLVFAKTRRRMGKPEKRGLLAKATLIRPPTRHRLM